MPSKHLLKIKSNQEIADKIYRLELAGDYDLAKFLPGKFLHIKCTDGLDPLLRRPMSVCDINDEGSLMTVLYRADGKGTKILSSKNPGDTLDVLAPLGVEFPTNTIKAGQQVLLIGGGIGVPPLYYLGRKLKQRGAKIKSILGFNSAKDVFYENDFKTLGETQISTMDGTYGHKGLVTDLVDNHWDILYSCGPTAMLRAVQGITPIEKQAYMSLEERMGCGVGACLACVCKSNDPNNTSYNRACTEGPVFPLHSINLG
jgi:dihydroorotate dehydrogenase electron transfer subunit